MQLTGTIKRINSKIKVNENFSKRYLILTTDPEGQKPQHIEFQFINKLCDKLDGLEVGEKITVDFTILGREWDSEKKGKIFINTLSGIDITKH
jgi:hypothetical protein